MPSASFQASVFIESPVLEVFDFVKDPSRLPHWVPFYASVEPIRSPPSKRGDRFRAHFSIVPPVLTRLESARGFFSTSFPIEVELDDIVHGRRLAYRTTDFSWATICDFRPLAGGTLFTSTQSLWSAVGLLLTYSLGPFQAMFEDSHQQILAGLKRRLEGRYVDAKPQVFFSYRREIEPGVSGRLFDALVAEFGLGTVWRDVNSLKAGRPWPKAIDEAVRASKVIVAHVGDGWEDRLVEQAKTVDPLRDELQLGLASEGTRLIPVITTTRTHVTLGDRMKEISEKLEGSVELKRNAKNICERFAPANQAQLLRPDPDFHNDLEPLLRSIWHAFRAG